MATWKLRVKGVTFANDDGTDRQEILRQVRAGDEVTLVRDLTNDFDRNAIKVVHAAGQIGFVPREAAVNLCRIGFDKQAVVTEIRGGTESAPSLGAELLIHAGRTSA